MDVQERRHLRVPRQRATRPAGLYGLYRWSFGEAESGPDPHFHRAITESFYVLEGDGASSTTAPDWVTAATGDFLHVPEGGHARLPRWRRRAGCC